MISQKLFHEICKRNGLVQCGPMNEYKFPELSEKGKVNSEQSATAVQKEETNTYVKLSAGGTDIYVGKWYCCDLV